MIGRTKSRLTLPDADEGGEAPEDLMSKEQEQEESMTDLSDTIQVTPRPDSAVAWRLRAWDDQILEAAWFDRGIVSMSADEVGDLTAWPGPEKLSRRLSTALPERGQQAIGTFVTYWRYFCIEMAPQDLVVAPLTGKRAGVARITGEYEYDANDREPRLRHQRQVEWLRTMPRADLDDDIRRVVNAPGTICRIGSRGAAARLS